MSKSRLELLKKELLEGDKGNYSTFSVRFSGYSARQLLNEIEFLQKRGESGKVAKKARRRAHKAEALARELVETMETLSRQTSGMCSCGTNVTCDICYPSKFLIDPLRKAKEALGDV